MTPAPTPDSGRTPIARFDLVVLDTPEPRRLAEFYGALLGWIVVDEDEDWITLRPDAGSSYGLAFQLAPDLVPPTWPDPAVPQQSHLDVTVDDLDEGEARVLAIGARPTGIAAGGFRAYLDPSGHPFCRGLPC
ncbi:VOC family protein [Nakamurella sp.]|uniref:VOC family protein n=1 Tax=Nakamurella sp. TaxID=1869182 RepID=UPI003B3A8023